jgi:WD40 repeat protein
MKILSALVIGIMSINALHVSDYSNVPLYLLITEESSITALAWSPDSTELAMAADDYVAIWDVEAGQRKYDFSEMIAIQSLAWNPNGTELAVYGTELIVWDTINRRYSEIVEFPDTLLLPAGSVDWNCRGDKLQFYKIIGETDEAFLHIWNEDNGEITTVGNVIKSVANVAAWHPTENWIASADYNVVNVWNADTGALITEMSTIDGSDYLFVTDITWSPDGNLLGMGVATIDTIAIHLWNVHESRLVQVFEPATNNFTSIDWNPAENLIASGSENGLTQIWDTTTGEVVATITDFSHVPDNSTSMRINLVRWSPDGNLLAIGNSDSTVSIWDASQLTSDMS